MIKKHRWLKVALLGSMLISTSMSALAQDNWPQKPIRFIIPQSAGTGNDVLARALADKLSKELEQSVLVENKPGANGILAANYLKSQKNDGYTMFLAGVSYLSWNPHLYSKLPYNPNTDFDGVAIIADTPFISIVSPKLGVKTFAEFKALIQANPNKYTFASAGVGNSTHLATELIKKQVPLEMEHIPFNGSGATTTSIVAGETPFMTTVPGGVTEMIKAGKLIPIAVTGDQRLPNFPETPTYKELGYDIKVPGWYAIVVKTGTDSEIVQKLNQAINRALQSPEMQKSLQTQSLQAVTSTPGDVKIYTERESKAWAPLIKELGIQQ